MIVTANGRCAVSPSPKGAVSIPSTLGGVKVTSIGNNAFRNCRGLTSVTIPSGVASIGSAAFGDCAELMNVTIPESLRNIGEWAFSGCFALKSVTIPPNVERIGGGAFINCRGLTSVTIPAKVASIGVAAFSYCSALKQINVDASNQTFTSIDGVLYTKDRSVLIAFPNALTSVEMPKSVTNIGWCAFEGCSGLKSVTIPEGVDSIESGAFKECGGLVSVTIPSSVKIIGAEAFMNCKGLKSVTLPEGLSEIWGSAFWGCGELASLTLPKGLTTIGDNAFRGLGKLTTVTIPAEVTSIGGSVFSYCGGLTQINVEAGNQKYTSVDGVLYTKDLTGLVMCPNGLTSVTIPESVTSIGPGAFIGCGKLTSVMLPSGVSHIREWAFEACNGLTSVTIPESVTKIDRYAFLNCGGLTSLTMRGERPDAPNNIFQGCGKLKSIHVPANAKSWAGMKKWHGIPLVFDGEDAGRQAQVEHRAAPKGGLARLRQRRMEAERQAAESDQRQAAAEREQQLKALLQIQEELRRQRKEKDAAQRRAGQAVNAAVQQQQATVDGYTWSYRVKYGAATIVSEKKGKYSCAVSPMPTGDVKIPVTLNGVKVTSIGDHAFLMCDGMTSVTIPSSVTNIGWSAFSGCRRLTSVTIPEGVKCIGKGAFSGCCGLTLVTIPASVMYIEDDAFSSSPELYNRETNGWSVRRGKGPTGNSLVSFAVDSDNPSYSSRNGLLCSKDGADLIVGVNGDINIPDGVKNISKCAFSDCRNLTSVTIPSSVTNIGFRAFYNCSALKFVTIPDNVTSIGATAFSGCSGLTSMTIPDSVTSIGASVFSGCSGLTSVTIPDSVTSIGSDAFAGTPFYGNQPDGMVVLGGGVLYAYKGECPSSVTIPSSVTSIGKRAFAACRGRLESVTIPSSVTNIDEHAFWHCSGIKSFSVASDNPSYSSRNRMLCTKGGATLIAGVIGVNGNATIPEGVANIGSSAFNGYSGLKSVTIPNGVTNIGNWAFHDCRKLTSVRIPEGVTSIGADAFLSCSGLTSVRIPNSVTSIGVGAFCTCSALKSVTMCGERPNVPNSLLPNNIFGNCGKLKSIHVPANAKSWAGMKAWQGIPLVFDGVDAAARSSADTNGVYCVIDISGGSNAERYPVSYLDSVPEGGWGDEYKTTKIVLRRVDAGTYPMLGNRKVTFTKPFYIGIFELTQKQIKLLSGDNNRKFVFEGDMRPADCLTWDEMRGKNEEFDYPKTKEVAPGSIIGKLRAKTGLFQIDLPTSYQFGCAWNAGTDGSGRDARLTGRHFSNQRDGKGGYTSKHTIVGSYQPNEWGIYDLHGNVWEMCLDYTGKLDAEDENDPVGPVEGVKRQLRGGGWHSSDGFVFSYFVPQTVKGGCRIVINVEARTEQRRQLEAIKEELRKAREESKVHEVFSLNAAPGSITELNLGDVPPLQFVYCPAGKFSMGYKEQPALSKVKEIEITSPFWVSKTPIRVDQLASLGINSITDARIGAAGIDDASIVVQKLPSVLKERFGKMLPPGYVFRLPTEAEFEYLQKAETKDKNAPTNIWGVERLYAGGYIGLLDRAPEYGKGVDVVNRWHDAMAWTDLVKVNYENQPDKDPVGWSDNPNWSVFRRGLARDCGGGKLITTQCNSNLYGFYFVVAPDVDKLNKFYWK